MLSVCFCVCFAVLSRVVRAEFPGNMTFEQRLKEMKEGATWIFGGRAFQQREHGKLEQSRE